MSDALHTIKAGKDLIKREIEGLQALLGIVDKKFVAAVELIAALEGRVIVSGMGKSGHIARKIAATLASTGTPAYFVHPGEASHGDLGMIAKSDAVIVLSNSGETKELEDIVEYSRRFAIPLIAIVRRATSTLVDSADIAFVLPEIPEASPTGAPTTSTTMMLAWGDALAMALLEKRGFGKKDFHVFHPGGKIGSRLTKVEKIMKTGNDMPLVTRHTKMSEALIEMTAKRLGCVGVVDKGILIGVVTDGDLRRHMDKDLLRQNVASIMSRKPVTIAPGALSAEAVSLMNSRSITSLFVVDKKKKPVGVVHIHDLLRMGAD